MLGYLIVQFLVFLIIIFVYKRGLDPDNMAVPITAALSNLITSALILLFLFAFGFF
ncbi:MAG: hypothetical protein ACTSSK_09135 [Candidatus Heimdallarchaeota archaeon]